MSDISLDLPLSSASRGSAVFDLAMNLLAARWRWGELTVIAPGAAPRRLVGAVPGPPAVLIVHDFRFAARVLANGEIGFAEGFMAGEWIVRILRHC